MKVRHPIFDWNKPYEVSDECVIVREPGAAGIIRAFPGTVGFPTHLRSLSEGALKTRDPNALRVSPNTFQLDALEMEVFLSFYGASKPLDVYKRIEKKSAWKRERMERFILTLRVNRLLVPAQRERVLRSSSDAGVLIIGVGTEYVRMACALSETIKAGNPTLPVALVSSKNDLKDLTDRAEGLFDKTVGIDPRDYWVDGRYSPFFIKMHADLLSPFGKTVLIDADSVVFPDKDINREIRSYGDVDIAPAVDLVVNPAEVEPETYIDWGFHARNLTKMGINVPLCRVHSYYFYFRRNRRVRSYFRDARSVYERMMRSRETFAPDEPAFMIATAMSDVSVHSGYYMPIAERAFLEPGPINTSHIRQGFLGLTMVGKKITKAIVDIYNATVKEAANKRGKAEAWLWKDEK